MFVYLSQGEQNCCIPILWHTANASESTDLLQRCSATNYKMVVSRLRELVAVTSMQWYIYIHNNIHIYNIIIYTCIICIDIPNLSSKDQTQVFGNIKHLRKLLERSNLGPSCCDTQGLPLHGCIPCGCWWNPRSFVQSISIPVYIYTHMYVHL